MQILKRRGFTIIEILVVIVIISILATVVTIFLEQSRRNSRDTERKADASEILTSVTQYVTGTGSSFISYPTPGGQSGACPVVNQTNPSVDDIGAFCVGASGRSYGMVNAQTGMQVQGLDGTNRYYHSSSIIQALQTAGYLAGSPKDPLNTVGTLTSTNDAGNTIPDYVLIRACSDGTQAFGNAGNLYAVWVMLENTPSSNDLANLNRVVGDSSASPGSKAYDFAAGNFQSLFQTNGYGVSNGSSLPSNANLSGQC